MKKKIIKLKKCIYACVISNFRIYIRFILLIRISYQDNNNKF